MPPTRKTRRHVYHEKALHTRQFQSIFENVYETLDTLDLRVGCSRCAFLPAFFRIDQLYGGIAFLLTGSGCPADPSGPALLFPLRIRIPMRIHHRRRALLRNDARSDDHLRDLHLRTDCILSVLFLSGIQDRMQPPLRFFRNLFYIGTKKIIRIF